MDKEEAKERIRERWEVWIRRPKAKHRVVADEDPGTIMLEFYGHIEKDWPDLFPSSANKNRASTTPRADRRPYSSCTLQQPPVHHTMSDFRE